MASDDNFTFQKVPGGLKVYAGELPIRTVVGADRAERNERHPGYSFLGADGTLISYITDGFLQRMARDVAKNPPGTCPVGIGAVMRMAEAIRAARINL